MTFLIIKLIFIKSIFTFLYVIPLVIILSEIFPKYEDKIYKKMSTLRVIYEAIVEATFIIFILLSSKCLCTIIVKSLLNIGKDKTDIIYYISYALIVSIIFSTIDKSYKKKIILIKDRLFNY